uniref:Shisa N-terminal domain-containing protein n=1 Tax=Felis catus TaxID=9685 RepID=A0ABI7Y1Z5_FELCA
MISSRPTASPRLLPPRAVRPRVPGAGASGARAAGAAGGVVVLVEVGGGQLLRGHLGRGRRVPGGLGRATYQSVHAGLLPGLLRCHGPVEPAVHSGDFIFCCGTCDFRFCCTFKKGRLSHLHQLRHSAVAQHPQGPARKDDSPHHPTKDKTTLILYIICGWDVMVLVGIFTKRGLEKAHRWQREQVSSAPPPTSRPRRDSCSCPVTLKLCLEKKNPPRGCSHFCRDHKGLLGGGISGHPVL